MKQKLPLHEWLFVGLFCSIVLLLSIIAYSRLLHTVDEKIQLPLVASKNKIIVYVEGEVAEPGVIEMPLKATMKDLLEKIKLLSTADLSHCRLRQRLYDGQTIKILKRYPIVIEIQGAVKEPGRREILSGTRVCDAALDMGLLPQADEKKILKQRRYLKEGDVLHIPEKGSARKGRIKSG